MPAVPGEPLDLPVRAAAPVVGVEHEYRVLRADDQVDFERLVHRLPVDGLRVDPTDANAYRTPWGGLITADGREAEVATPPVPLRPGCTTELEWRTLVAYDSLRSALPEPFRLDGYSTHLNVEIDDEDVVMAGQLFVRHFAPSMMLLLDRAHSPGLLVRPRRDRLELGGEYCRGPQLRAAATFAAAAGLTCAAAARARDHRALPRPVRGHIRPAKIRAGWYVDRCAFGPDLYAHGRATPLAHGRRAQDHLVEAWTWARPTVEPLLQRRELLLVDDIVDGRRAIPLEGEDVEPDGAPATAPDVFARATRRRQRAGYVVEPVAISWHAIAFALRGARTGYACIPRAALSAYLDALDAGELDATIQRFLAAPPQGRVLRDSTQASTPGLFDELASPGAVAPPERIPGHRLGGRGGGTPRDARRNKHRRRSGPRPLVVAAVVAVGIVVLAVGAYALIRDDRTTPIAASAAGGVPFDVEFTVESVTVGPHYRGEPVPTIGSRATARLTVECADTCRFANDAAAGGPFVDLSLPLPEVAPAFYRATRDTSDSSSSCGHVGDLHEESSVQLDRDASGAIRRFTGRFEARHPNGVEATTPQGTCSTFDITYTFVGTPA